jgi:hypothetical protein
MFHISNQPLNNVPFSLLQTSQQFMKVTALAQLSKGKAIPVTVSFQIFYTIGSQMAVRLSALSAVRPLHKRRFLVLISVRGSLDPRAKVRLEGLGQLKNPIT